MDSARNNEGAGKVLPNEYEMGAVAMSPKQPAERANTENTVNGSKAGEEEKPAETVSKTAAIILVLAIGAHAFFEGIAFGLQTTIESAGQLAAGILIHKSAAAISLGGAFARTGFSMKEIIIFLGVFSLLAPIGIIIGMQIAESNKLVDVTFLSLSGGTFVYVACSEIIVNEF